MEVKVIVELNQLQTQYRIERERGKRVAGANIIIKSGKKICNTFIGVYIRNSKGFT